MEEEHSPIRRPPNIEAFGPPSLTNTEDLHDPLDSEEVKNENLKSASDALRTRICYVSQVVLFLVALVSLTIGLTVGYNKDESGGSRNKAKDSGGSKADCPFDVAGKTSLNLNWLHNPLFVS